MTTGVIGIGRSWWDLVSKGLLDEITVLTSYAGSALKKKLLKAIPERIKHQAAYEAFTESQEGGHVDEWRAMVLDFERDGQNPNPYHLPKSGMFPILPAR